MCIKRIHSKRMKISRAQNVFPLTNVITGTLRFENVSCSVKQELSYDSIARLNCALPITKIIRA